VALPEHSLVEYQAVTPPVAAGALAVPRRDLLNAECVCSSPAPQAFSPAEVLEMAEVFSLQSWALAGGFFRYAGVVAVVPA
jgi:hypothetical protein